MRFTLCLLPVLLFACAEETDLETAFCDQLANGPQRQVAAVDGPEGAPGVNKDGTAFRIALIERDGEYWGQVAYKADERGNFAMGLSHDVPMRITNPEGEEVTLKNKVTGSSCPELAARYTAKLGLRTYTIEFGPTDVPEIGFVSEESDDDL